MYKMLDTCAPHNLGPLALLASLTSASSPWLVQTQLMPRGC